MSMFTAQRSIDKIIVVHMLYLHMRLLLECLKEIMIIMLINDRFVCKYLQRKSLISIGMEASDLNCQIGLNRQAIILQYMFHQIQHELIST